MKYWKRIDEASNITTVESYSHSLAVEGAIKITKAEYNAFIASLPEPELPEPPLVFEPPPGTGIPKRVEYIEQFLKELERRETE